MLYGCALLNQEEGKALTDHENYLTIQRKATQPPAQQKGINQWGTAQKTIC